MEMMKAIQVAKSGAQMELKEVPVPTPNDEQVLLKVEACGICHGDSKIIEGAANAYPRIPGHEVVGKIVEVGKGVKNWHLGQRVGLGWHGGHGQTTAITMDGGYAEYMVAYEDALIEVPAGISAEEAAPLLCAGETTFSALHNSSARLGDLVAVSGVGGLGHFAIQYAKKAGFRVVAISRGSQKEQLAKELGADYYIDSEELDFVTEIQKLGGAKVIIATAPNAKVIAKLIDGLVDHGELILTAVDEQPLNWSAMDFLNGAKTVKGTFTDINEMEAAVKFSILTNALPLIEVYPLEQAAKAYEKMMAGETYFRAVLKMEN